MRPISIVCTIGPRSKCAKKIKEFYDAGMSLARLNGSHGNLDWHKETVELIRKTLPDLPILIDIPGKKIRTKDLEVEPTFSIGDVITLTCDQQDPGVHKIPINNESLFEKMKPGDIIFADDGTLKFKVKNISERDIHCICLCAGKLKSRKGINVPQVSLDGDLVTDADRKMLAFVAENEIDMVGVSFVESAAHLDLLRSQMLKWKPRIVAKIENKRGLDNVAEIVKSTDIIMIDRGDLSVETSISKTNVYQKEIVHICKKFGTPVIVATEVLHTMISSPFPTKAEISDISNATVDGANALMLSGETAIGDFPVEAIKTIFEVSKDVKKSISQDTVERSCLEKINSVLDTLSFDKLIVKPGDSDCFKYLAFINQNDRTTVLFDNEQDLRVTKFLGDFNMISNAVLDVSSGTLPHKIIRRMRERGHFSEGEKVCFIAFQTAQQRLNVTDLLLTST